MCPRVHECLIGQVIMMINKSEAWYACRHNWLDHVETYVSCLVLFILVVGSILLLLLVSYELSYDVLVILWGGPPAQQILCLNGHIFFLKTRIDIFMNSDVLLMCDTTK